MTERRTDERTDGQMNGRKERRTDERTDGQMNRRKDGRNLNGSFDRSRSVMRCQVEERNAERRRRRRRGRRRRRKKDDSDDAKESFTNKINLQEQIRKDSSGSETHCLKMKSSR